MRLQSSQSQEPERGIGLVDLADGRFSPLAERYLTKSCSDRRRRILEKIRERLRIEGSPVVVACAGEQPLIAYAVPADDTTAATSRSRALLNITDLEDLPVPPESLLRRLFDLTPAEVRLAQALARGDTLEHAARALGVRITTARTQLAAIFEKSETHRQAKLVALLSRLAHLSC
jgi:DNA-binding CsgD family transcriptional regulator